MMIKNEKPGLIMLLASLLVMGITVYLLFDYQRSTREQQAREQGLALARLISSMPWDQVVGGRGKGLLDALSEGQNNPDFSYAQIIDNHGKVVKEVASRGVVVPNHPLSGEPANWVGQRVVEASNNDANFIESHAPLFSRGVHKGFVKLGYREPKASFSYAQMPFIATLTLPIFLLTPLFYYFLRQELKPLRKISQSIDEISSGYLQQPLELQPNAELGQFMERFNQFIESTQAHIRKLDDEQNELFVSGKLLSYKNSKIESILQTMPEAILVIDKAGMVSYANQKISSLLGIDVARVLNKKPRQWCKTPELVSIMSGNYNKGSVATITGAVLSESESNQRKKFEVRTYPLFSPKDDSQLLGRLVVIRDVTEQFFEQQRQGEFIAQIAHELKTPLNVLAMYSETLIDEELTSPDMRIEAANVIHDEVERLATLIQNLLTISQYELGGLLIERQRVRMKDFLQDIFDTMAKSDHARQLKFELDLPHDMSAAYIDKALMRIAINNLLSNAIKYNREGGSVVMEAKETDGSIEISVSDEGYGISEQDQNHIFDKFFRSDDSHIREKTGHGLGLSLARHIVMIHQGELTVNSAVGQGSIFKITLDNRSENIAG
jgi:two-component system sensor histidine kinase VicK